MEHWGKLTLFLLTIFVICRPNSADVEKITQMIDAGMDVARINFSEGDQKTHGESLSNLESALEKRPLKKCPIIFETQGPEIFLECIRDDQDIEIRRGQELQIVIDRAIESDDKKVACNYSRFPQACRKGNILYIGGGLECDITDVYDVSSF